MQLTNQKILTILHAVQFFLAGTSCEIHESTDLYPGHIATFVLEMKESGMATLMVGKGNSRKTIKVNAVTLTGEVRNRESDEIDEKLTGSLQRTLNIYFPKM